jgi:hypothetical protein
MKSFEFYLVNKKHLKDLVFHRQFLSSITEKPFATYKKLKLKAAPPKLYPEDINKQHIGSICACIAKILDFYIVSKRKGFYEKFYYYKNLNSQKPIKRLVLHVNTKYIKILDSKIDLEAFNRLSLETSILESLKKGEHLISMTLPNSFKERIIQNYFLYERNKDYKHMYEGIFNSKFVKSLKSVTPINFSEVFEENDISTEEPIIDVKICLD